jgi:hypothetical protein
VVFLDKVRPFITRLIVKIALVLLVPVYARFWEPYSPEASISLYSALLEYSSSSGWSISELFPILLSLTILFSIPGIYFEYRLESHPNFKTMLSLAIAFTIITLAGPYSIYFLFYPGGPFYDLISWRFGIFSIIVPSLCAVITIVFIFYPILENQILRILGNSENWSTPEEFKQISRRGTRASILLSLALFVLPFELVISQYSFGSTGLFWSVSSWAGTEFEINYSINLFASFMSFSIITNPIYFWFYKKVFDYFKGMSSMRPALWVGVVGMLSVYSMAILFVLLRGFAYAFIPIPLPFQLLLGYFSMRIGKDIRAIAKEDAERVWTDERSEL